MIFTFSQLALSILAPVCAGYALVALLFSGMKVPFGLRVSLSFGAGFALTALIMLGMSVLNVTLSPAWIYMMLFAVGSGCCFSLRKLRFQGLTIPVFTEKKETQVLRLHGRIIQAMVIILSIYIAYNVIYAFWRSLTYPISSLETMATAALQAKMIFYERTMPPFDILHGPHFSPLTPLLESWIAMNLGQWHDFWTKLIFPCALTSLLLMVYTVLAHYTDRLWGLLGCCILLSSNYLTQLAAASHIHFLSMYYNVSGILLICLWIKSRRSPFLLLAGLFAGILMLACPEGPAYVVIYILLFFLCNFIPKAFDSKQKMANSLIFLAPVILMAIAIFAFDAANSGGGNADFQMETAPTGYAHVPMLTVLDLIAQNMFFSGNWGIGWFLFLLGLTRIRRCAALQEVMILTLAILLFIQVDMAMTLAAFENALTAGKTNMLYYSRGILNYFPLAAVGFILMAFPNRFGPGPVTRI